MARVLTEAEVRKLPFRDMFKRIPVLIEERTNDGGSIVRWRDSAFAREQYFDSLRSKSEEYGETFRIWDEMPTREEADAVAWKGKVKYCADCEYSTLDKCDDPCCYCVDHSEFVECEGGEEDE